MKTQTTLRVALPLWALLLITLPGSYSPVYGAETGASTVHPAWTDGQSRAVIGGDILHLGIGYGKTPEMARFKSEAMAVKNLISECSLAHRDTVIWDRYLETLDDGTYKGYARAGLDFQSCEEAKHAKGEQRKILSNPALVQNQDLYNQLEFAQDHSDDLFGKIKTWVDAMLGKQNRRLADLEEKVANIEKQPQPTIINNTIIERKTVLFGGDGEDRAGRYRDCIQEYNELMNDANRLAQNSRPFPGNLASPQAAPAWNRAMRKLSYCRTIGGPSPAGK